MLTGFLGLTIGYGLLMLAPGNFLRIVGSHESAQNFLFNLRKMLTLWFSVVLQSMLWFYLWKVYRKRKALVHREKERKYLQLVNWFAVNSCFFNLIMLFAPEFPNRSLFPGLIFTIISVFVAAYLANKGDVAILNLNTIKWNYILATLYFSLTFVTTTWWYIQEFFYEEEIMQQVEQFKGSDEVLILNKIPPHSTVMWTYLTGIHKYSYGLSNNENRWENIAFARFHHLKGVRLVKE